MPRVIASIKQVKCFVNVRNWAKGRSRMILGSQYVSRWNSVSSGRMCATDPVSSLLAIHASNVRVFTLRDLVTVNGGKHAKSIEYTRTNNRSDVLCELQTTADLQRSLMRAVFRK